MSRFYRTFRIGRWTLEISFERHGHWLKIKGKKDR